MRSVVRRFAAIVALAVGLAVASGAAGAGATTTGASASSTHSVDHGSSGGLQTNDWWW